MTQDRGSFNAYDVHYRRMGNRPGAGQIDPLDARDHRKPWMHDLPPSAAILDCGCGYGLQLQALHHLGYRNLYGIELVNDMARAAAESLYGMATVEHADAVDWLPRHTGRFDAVFLNDVLEHIPREDAVAFLILIRQALKPGGVLHVRVPNMATLLASYSMHLDLTHVCGYTEYSLMQALDLAGFAGHATISSRPPLHLSPLRPLKILKRLGRLALHTTNHALHRFCYLLRFQTPVPGDFGMNLEIWTRRRAG